jgi:hypothetical protein
LSTVARGTIFDAEKLVSAVKSDHRSVTHCSFRNILRGLKALPFTAEMEQNSSFYVSRAIVISISSFKRFTKSARGRYRASELHVRVGFPNNG